MFQVKKVATKWPVRDRNGWSEERREQTKYIGEWFQENVCKTNITSPISSAKIAKQSEQKPKSWCTTLKAWQLQHLNVNLFCAFDSLLRLTARCPVLVWYTVINMRLFGEKNNRNHSVGFLTSSVTRCGHMRGMYPSTRPNFIEHHRQNIFVLHIT